MYYIYLYRRTKFNTDLALYLIITNYKIKEVIKRYDNEDLETYCLINYYNNIEEAKKEAEQIRNFNRIKEKVVIHIKEEQSKLGLELSAHKIDNNSNRISSRRTRLNCRKFNKLVEYKEDKRNTLVVKPKQVGRNGKEEQERLEENLKKEVKDLVRINLIKYREEYYDWYISNYFNYLSNIINYRKSSRCNKGYEGYKKLIKLINNITYNIINKEGIELEFNKKIKIPIIGGSIKFIEEQEEITKDYIIVKTYWTDKELKEFIDIIYNN